MSTWELIILWSDGMMMACWSRLPNPEIFGWQKVIPWIQRQAMFVLCASPARMGQKPLLQMTKNSKKSWKGRKRMRSTRQLKEQFMREQTFNFSRVVSGTRLHFRPDVKEIPEATVHHLRGYVEQAKALGVIAAIAVNTHVDLVKQIAAEAEPNLTLHVLHVPCWGAFVPALNALLNFAQSKGAKYILYQSLEVCCSRDVLQRIMDHHDSDTLVVGPVLDGHKFRPGERILDGRSSPWNTLALWSVRKLALTGFLCIADGLPDVPPSLNAADGLGMLEAMNMPEGSAPMGSDSWWSGEDYPSFGFSRQMTTQKQAVPAGEQRQNHPKPVGRGYSNYN